MCKSFKLFLAHLGFDDCADVLLCTEKPNPPTRLTISDVTSSSFKISWCCADGNVVSFEVKYRRQSQNSVEWAEQSETVTSTEYTVIGLQPTTVYSVYLLAVSSSGGRSLPSDVLQCTTLPSGEVHKCSLKCDLLIILRLVFGMLPYLNFRYVT